MRLCQRLSQEHNLVIRQLYILNKIESYGFVKIQDFKVSLTIINFVGLSKKGTFKWAMRLQSLLPELCDIPSVWLTVAFQIMSHCPDCLQVSQISQNEFLMNRLKMLIEFVQPGREMMLK